MGKEISEPIPEKVHDESTVSSSKDAEIRLSNEQKTDEFADIRRYYPEAQEWELEVFDRALKDYMLIYQLTFEQAVTLNKIMTGEIHPSQHALQLFQETIQLMDLPIMEKRKTLSKSTKLQAWSLVIRVSDEQGTPITS